VIGHKHDELSFKTVRFFPTKPIVVCQGWPARETHITFKGQFKTRKRQRDKRVVLVAAVVCFVLFRPAPQGDVIVVTEQGSSSLWKGYQLRKPVRWAQINHTETQNRNRTAARQAHKRALRRAFPFRFVFILEVLTS
jgi:hypothetical protein